MSHSYQISIAMCTYNGEHFLDQQLQTIVDQEYPIHEIVIVDDQSTDKTVKILEKWQTKYPTLFKYYRNDENLGFDKNFEKAISLCNGELIAVADQDDIWMSNKLTSLAPLFNNPKVMLAHGASVTLKNGKLHYFSGQLKRYHLFEGSDSRKLFLLNQISGHNMIFRHSLLKDAFPIPMHIHYDWWLALQATAQGEVKAFNKYLVHHRKHGQNAFFSNQRKKCALSLLERIKLFKQIKGLSEASIAFLNTLIGHLERRSLSKEKFDWAYFKFLFAHRKIILGHKKRISKTFTYFTNSLKLSRQ